jgi:predicted transcriptional regulator YdeE
MEHESVSKAEFKVIGISQKISNQNAQEKIPEMWKTFILENYLDKIPNKKDGRLMAFYSNYEGDHTKPFLYTIGCEVTSLDECPSIFNKLTIPGNRYALFKVKGNLPNSLIEAWKHIWTSDIGRKFEADFEVVVGPDEVHIYISVK